MKIKISIVFIINLLFLGFCLKPALAELHTQSNGLFSMDIPAQWHWNEFPEEIVIAYPDRKTMAIDIQLMPSRALSQVDIKKTLKENDDKMVKEGIKAHNGVVIDDKEIDIDGVYARQLDFDPTPQNPTYVRYISFFSKGYAFTITFGSGDEKMRLVLEDVVGTLRFK